MCFLRANSLYTDAKLGMVMDPKVYRMAAGESMSAYFEFESHVDS